MRLVHNESGPMVIANMPQSREIGRVGIHAEVRFRHHPRSSAVTPIKRRFHRSDVQVWNHRNTGPRQTDAIDERSVVQGVTNNPVIFADKARQGTNIGSVTARKEQDLRHLQPCRK
jgi:hypothetical protein